MKFLIVMGALALLVGAFAAKDSDMISRGKKLISQAENWVKELEKGHDPDRFIITQINQLNPRNMKKMVEKMESGSELSQSEKEQFNNMAKRMEEERKVFNGIFKGHETDPTAETLINEAKAMIKDADSKELTGAQKELVADLKQRLENHKQWGYSSIDGRSTLTSMVNLNEVTNFY